MSPVSGKTAIVTGAGSGIGHMTSEVLAPGRATRASRATGELTKIKALHRVGQARRNGASSPLGALPSTVLSDPAPLIGREREMETIRTHLLGESVRLVTLTGSRGDREDALGPRGRPVRRAGISGRRLVCRPGAAP
jgi:NAD(P)-dependent dehydrogenase (short-subunit alcohol dehydrogenase family)